MVEALDYDLVLFSLGRIESDFGSVVCHGSVHKLDEHVMLSIAIALLGRRQLQQLIFCVVRFMFYQGSLVLEGEGHLRACMIVFKLGK